MKKRAIILIFAAFFSTTGCGGTGNRAAGEPKSTSTTDSDSKVREIPVHADVTVFILTHCPYAAEAVRSLLVLKEEMGHSLNLDFGYIGMIDNNGKPDIKMGALEVETARAHICVSQTVRESQWFDFLTCVYEGEKWRSMPGTWRECAGQLKIDINAVEACINSGKGDQLLASAYEASVKSEILSSPTIFIGNIQYAGGYSIASMRRALCFRTGNEETRPAACESVDPYETVAGMLLYDSRCSGRDLCEVSEELDLIGKMIPGLKLERIDYKSEQGSHLYNLIQKTGADLDELPLVVLDNAVAKDENAMSRLADYLSPFGPGYVIALGGGWNPTHEICDNKVDDNEDGKIDCLDTTCLEKAQCRAAKTGRLDLFAMSECPFFWEVFPSIKAVIEHFDGKRNKIDFNLQFIGNFSGGKFSSMHGEKEVAENLRMLCAQELWKKSYKFMDYVSCRIEAMKSSGASYESCVKDQKSLKELKSCADGKRGAALLKKSFNTADWLGIKGSPSWLLNNQLPMEGRTPSEILKSFCEQNKSAECESPIADDLPASFGIKPEKCL